MTKRIIFGVGDDFLKREGLSGDVEVWEDSLRTHPEKDEFEWWYFDAHFDDHSTAVIVFYTKSMLNPKSSFKPVVTVTITRPDGEKIFRVFESTPEHFSAMRDRCDTHIGGNHIHGDLHQYQLHADIPAVGDLPCLQADLEFTGKVPAWRPGTGKNYYDQQFTSYFAWLPAIPFGTVKGTLVYDGKQHKVKGAGYHDHNWGNIALSSVLSHWYWGRASVGEYGLIFVQMTALRKYKSLKMPVFLLTKGRKILTGDGVPLKLETVQFIQHTGGKKYPRQLDFHWEGEEGEVYIALRHPVIIEATSLLGMLPTFQRRLARLFINPYYFRFQAEMELSINWKGQPAHEKGQALYELMMLR